MADTRAKSDKRTAETPLQAVQAGSAQWWSKHPMAYDWHGSIQGERGTQAWFDAIDSRFIHGARLFAHDVQPFDRIIPFDRLAGKRVLEIGCGMGLHTELIARAGADLSSIDISETSIANTRRRLELKGLQADVRLCDAERIPFENDTFDFVWSWGVIHHSARTGRVVREISRVLRPSGEARIMVYNRDGLPAWITVVRYLLGLRFFKRSLDEELFRATDGFMARYYTRDQFEDLFRTFFEDVSSQVCGQESDAVPLPRQLRPYALKFVSEQAMKRSQASRGAFVFLTAKSKI